jgi:hypothetical protein
MMSSPPTRLSPRRPVAADATDLILLPLSGAQRTWPGPAAGSGQS